jgi:hypothetical protein
MPFYILTLSGLLATVPLLSLAQAPAEAASPRYYVGLGAYSSAYQPLGGSAYHGTRMPFQVVVGYQVQPRLAMQLGVAYSGVSASYTNDGRYVPAPGSAGVYYNYTTQATEHNTSVALLARYTLTRQLAHRLQVDLLGGITLEASHYTSQTTNTDSARVPVTSYQDYRGTIWASLLTAGPSMRYRFGPHLEALLDFTLNYEVNRNRPYSSTLTGATALGLRYRFGRR